MSSTACNSLHVETCVSASEVQPREIILAVRDYDLSATLQSGQSFRWQKRGEEWEGVLGARWVRLTATPDGIKAATAEDVADWAWLARYLQTEVDLNEVLARFPNDEPMRRAVTCCRGLRLLRQDPWECLASFILSSTKRIAQIQQIVTCVCQRFGQAVAVPPGTAQAYSFPGPEVVAGLSEAELRDCKMGFRAPYLRAAGAAVAAGRLDLARLCDQGTHQARFALSQLRGVGPKIADCVLLFAYGRQDAFPVDTWVMRALRDLYFGKQRVTKARLESFVRAYFGPYAGYAQQYLFHYVRTRSAASRVAPSEFRP